MSAVMVPRTGSISLGTIRPDGSIRYALDAVGIDFPVGYMGVKKCCIVLCYVLIIMGETHVLLS